MTRSCPSTPESYISTNLRPNMFPSGLNFGTSVLHHTPNDVCIVPCPSGSKFSNFECSNSKLGSHLWSMYHKPSIELGKHTLVWIYITLWPQNSSWPTKKVSYALHKLWSTLVWPDLKKIITNSKYSKMFWYLHIWQLCVQSLIFLWFWGRMH